MKTAYVVSVIVQTAAVLSAAVRKLVATPESNHGLNSMPAVDSVAKRAPEDWNAAAWSNFVKSYVEGAEDVKRGENWNAAAWSNFVKSYVDGAEVAKD